MKVNKTNLYKLINYVLNKMEMFNYFDVNQLAGTCAVESNMGKYINFPSGEQGIFKMSHQAEKDLHENFLKQNNDLALKVSQFGRMGELANNQYYAVAMAFMQYYQHRISGDKGYKAGKPEDIKLMAWNWKKYYTNFKKECPEMDFFHKYKLLILYNNEV